MYAVLVTYPNPKRSAKMPSQKIEHLSQAVSKGMEQGGAVVGGSIALHQILIEHKDIILIYVAIASLFIAFIGYITNSIMTFYFKYQHLQLAKRQQRRNKD